MKYISLINRIIVILLVAVAPLAANCMPNSPEIIEDGEGVFMIKSKYGVLKIDTCKNVVPIDGSDRYVGLVNAEYENLMIDLLTKKSYPVSVSYLEYVEFLKELPSGPVFCTGNSIYGLDNKVIIISDDGGVNEYDSRFGDYLYFYSPSGLGRIKYEDLEWESLLEPEAGGRAAIEFSVSGLSKGIYNSISFTDINLSIPIVSANPVLRQNILFWISENADRELGFQDDVFTGEIYGGMGLYVPTLETTEECLLNYYVNKILHGFREVEYKSEPLELSVLDDQTEYDREEMFSQFWGGGFTVKVMPLMENDSFVTLYGVFDSSFGGGSGWGSCVIPVATFDKVTGMRITLRDLINEDNLDDFASYLRKEITDKWDCQLNYSDDVSLLSMPVGVLHDRLYLVAPRHTLVGIGADMYIPFSDIADWMKLVPEPNTTEVSTPVFYRNVISRPFPLEETDSETTSYSDSTDEEPTDYPDLKAADIRGYFQTVDSIQTKYQMPADYGADAAQAASTINGGCSTVMAALLMNGGDHKGAYDMYRILCDKYGHVNPLGNIPTSLSGVLYSGVIYADELIDKGLLDQAESVIEYIERFVSEESPYDMEITDDSYVSKADIGKLRSRISDRRGTR